VAKTKVRSTRAMSKAVLSITVLLNLNASY
jgi:hypothetical protein